MQQQLRLSGGMARAKEEAIQRNRDKSRELQEGYRAAAKREKERKANKAARERERRLQKKKQSSGGSPLAESIMSTNNNSSSSIETPQVVSNDDDTLLSTILKSQKKLEEDEDLLLDEEGKQDKIFHGMFNKFANQVQDTRSTRKEILQARRSRHDALVQTLSQKKARNGDASMERSRMEQLRASQQQPLADTLATNVESPPALTVEATDDTEETDGPELEEHDDEARTPRKSALKKENCTTTQASPSIMSRLFGFSDKKKTLKRNVSFGEPQVQEFETSPSERRVRLEDIKKGVVISDDEKYDEWRSKTDQEFIRAFTKKALGEMSPSIVRQTLHAANVMELLLELKPSPLKRAARKAFPNNKFRVDHREKVKQIKKRLNEEYENEKSIEKKCKDHFDREENEAKRDKIEADYFNEDGEEDKVPAAEVQHDSEMKA